MVTRCPECSETFGPCTWCREEEQAEQELKSFMAQLLRAKYPHLPRPTITELGESA